MSGRHDGKDVIPDLSLFNILLYLVVLCGLVEVKLMLPSIGPIIKVGLSQVHHNHTINCNKI